MTGILAGIAALAVALVALAARLNPTRIEAEPAPAIAPDQAADDADALIDEVQALCQHAASSSPLAPVAPKPASTRVRRIR